MDPGLLSGFIGAGVTIVIAGATGFYGYGKFKGNVVTKKDCTLMQNNQSSEISAKISEMKALIIKCQDENANRIDQIHQKIDTDRNTMYKNLLELNSAVSRIEGKLSKD